MKKLKLNVVDELRKVRRKHATASSAEIEKASAEVLVEIEKRRRKSP